MKVDREERPDVDALYMEAVQGMTGHGGWPLNVFLTPEQLPFYGGTYFPPEPRHGLPSWTQVLQAIAETWRENAAEIRAGGERVRAQLSGGARLEPSGGALRRGRARRRGGAAAGVLRHASTAASAARRSSRRPLCWSSCCATASARCRSPRCARWRAGASTTSSAGAFTATPWTRPGRCRTSRRCSTTTRCSRAPTCTGTASRRRRAGRSERGRRLALEVCRADTLDWALREMRGPEGGFYSALDADSEGVEGRFYVWTVGELEERPRARTPTPRSRWLGVSEDGNFVDPHHPEPGLNVLDGSRAPPPHGPTRHPRAHPRAAAGGPRRRRTRPGLDDKRLTSWNALMIAALADAGAVLAKRPPLPRRGGALRGVRPARAARRRGAAAAHLLRGPRADRRLPGGPRLPAGGAAGALRGDLRGALADRGARARRADDRALRRPRARRLLLDAPPTASR